MILRVANPIYDSVFKYLVEDLRIAKILISAFLKKEVLEVEVRKHEYTNGTRDNISMFRIDFGAKVRESDGSQHLVLIELQKTWLETETLRFRQYLGAQYANPDNIGKEESHEFGIPMVTVYLLGHKVGDIKEPIIYAVHKAYDYYGNEVTEGIPDPFVESLVHDSIIVQIPRLRGRVNNKLEKVLSVFDQTHKDKYNRQMLNIDEDNYEDDTDMMYILRRLLAAASDAKLRQDMNVEDEYFTAIENRDTAIMNRDKKIAEQDQYITEQKNQIAEQNNQIAERNNQIAERNNQIAEHMKTLQATINSLINRGMSLDEISVVMGKTVEEIKSIIC